MTVRKFEIAAEDHEAAKVTQEYHLEVFEIGDEAYAAVRPVTSAFSALLKDLYGIRSDPENTSVTVFSFLNVCFNRTDLTEALLEQDEYVNDDGELTAEGVELASSNTRLTNRMMDRHDDLGEATMVKVMIDLVEGWAGKDTGSRLALSPRSSTTGKRSTAKRSSGASTRSTSTTSRRPASSARRTSG